MYRSFSKFLFIAISLTATVSATLYCPGQNDFDYGGNIQWNGNGWTMTGPGGVHGKTAFNLLGGYIQFDMDTSRAHVGVNNNLYTSSPDQSTFPNYCDIQDGNHPHCMEMDIIENNGNCLAQTTWHTWPNHNGDCDQGGCWGQMYQPNGGIFNLRADFSADGWMTVKINGQSVNVQNPVPSNNAKNYVKEIMGKLGAQIHSTQWVGWVPGGNCSGGGSLDSSTFSVRNLRVSGSVIQGKVPATCSSMETMDLEEKLEDVKEFLDN